jgi:predicted GNAT family acetyltransferase
MSADPSIAVRHAPESERYEALADGMLAGFAAYRSEGSAVVFVHTDVDDAFRGRGVGGALAREALADVRRRGLLAVPMCPFFAAWIRRHPDYADLVPEESRHLVDAPPGGG